MAAPTKDQIAKDRRLVKAWTAQIVDNDKIDRHEDQHWESLWHGFVIGKGRPELATFTHYMRLGFPAAMARPVVQRTADAVVDTAADD